MLDCCRCCATTVQLEQNFSWQRWHLQTVSRNYVHYLTDQLWCSARQLVATESTRVTNRSRHSVSQSINQSINHDCSITHSYLHRYYFIIIKRRSSTRHMRSTDEFMLQRTSSEWSLTWEVMDWQTQRERMSSELWSWLADVITSCVASKTTCVVHSLQWYHAPHCDEVSTACEYIVRLRQLSQLLKRPSQRRLQ